jgi:hypothetical protein
MANTPPNAMERGYLLPAGCKDLVDVLKFERKQEMVSWGIRVWRKNEMISAPQVRVIGVDGDQVGVLLLAEALQLARSLNADLVEIAPDAHPPVCRLLDYVKLGRAMSK